MRFLSAAALIFLLASPAAAEWSISAYLGGTNTQNSYLAFRNEANGDNLRFEDVEWESRDFDGPLYYGIRSGHFFRYFGIETEFNHLKVFARTDRTYPASGEIAGTTLTGQRRMDDFVQQFGMSHGVNLLMLNAVVRVPLFREEDEKLGRLIVAGRVGGGRTFPHPEARAFGQEWSEYDVGSGVFHLAAGAEVKLAGPVFVFGEYKHTRMTQEVHVGPRAFAESPVRTHHFITGLALHF